ncbi:MAG TPA: DNA methyltransferase [Candidatus Tectomicrobia bacterium]
MLQVLNQTIESTHAIYHGDNAEVIQGIPDDSIDYIIFSPPFSNLFTYSASERDMGNCRGDGEFFAHYRFLSKELYRVLKPGRLMSIHCMNLQTSKVHDGYIGLRDFRGDLIRLHQDDGMIFHSEVTIWKDPVVAMQRTKALGLLYKQLRKDSAMSRQGIPDYLCTFRKPGINPDPVTKDPDEFPCELWQRYASPVWMDINPSRTLQRTSARDEKDERHIAPLQLEVIERGIRLWTNPGDVVLDPFAGIGSTGYCAVPMGRKFVGMELKDSYYRQMEANMREAVQGQALFTWADEQDKEDE